MTRVLDVREPAQTFRFAGIAAKPVPSLLRGFSAPVHVEFDYAPEELAFLAAHDSDPVNRWDAAQRSFTDAILALARDHREGRPLALPAALAGIVRMLLADRVSDPALLAQALTPAGPRIPCRHPGRHRRRRRRRGPRLRAQRTGPRAVRRVRARVRRPARPRVVRADARADRCAQARERLPALSRQRRRRGRARARRRALRRRRQHDGQHRRAGRTDGRRVARARRALRAVRGEVARRAAGARQVVRAGSDVRARRHARARAQAARASAVQRAQSEPRALARRRVHAAQLRALQRGGRRGLRVRRGPGAGARRDQPAARGDDRRCVHAVEALPRAAARPDAGHAAADRAAPGLSPDVTEVVTRTLAD